MHTSLKHGFLFILLMSAATIAGTDLESIFRDWRIIRPPVADRTSDVVETNDGNLVISTLQSGVWLYDGYRFTRLEGLENIPVQKLLITKSDEIYAASDVNIHHYKNNQWVPVLPRNNGFFWFIPELYETCEGDILAGSLWGMLRIHNDQTSVFTAPELLPLLSQRFPELTIIPVPVPAGFFPISSREDQLFIYQSISMNFETFVAWVDPKSPAYKAGIRPTDRLLTLDGKKIPKFRRNFFSPNQKQLHFSVQSLLEQKTIEGSFPLSDREIGYRGFPVTSIFEDSGNRLWIAFFYGGAARAEQNSDGSLDWTWYSRKEIPQLKGGWSGGRIKEDGSGKIWIASKGVVCFENDKYLKSSDELFGQNTVVNKIGDQVWLSDWEKLVILDKGHKEVFDPTKLPGPYKKKDFFLMKNGNLVATKPQPTIFHCNPAQIAFYRKKRFEGIDSDHSAVFYSYSEKGRQRLSRAGQLSATDFHQELNLPDIRQLHVSPKGTTALGNDSDKHPVFVQCIDGKSTHYRLPILAPNALINRVRRLNRYNNTYYYSNLLQKQRKHV